MIEYIDAQLNQWSKWVRSGRYYLGYPRKAVFIDEISGRCDSMPDDEALAISRAVNALEPKLKQTIDCYYLSMSSCPVGQIAKYLSCTRDCVYRRIDRAHIMILGYLNDIESGIEIRH